MGMTQRNGKNLNAAETCLNSTLVRCSLWNFSLLLQIGQCLNSTLVRCSLKNEADWIRKEKRFKFHTGSMLTNYLKTTYPKAYMFKFHTGSMLTKCDYLAYISDKEFKFHTGSMLTNQKRE